MTMRVARFSLYMCGVLALATLATALFRFTPGLVAGDTSRFASELCGESKFDFGVVAIEGQPARLEHVFELTNCSATPIKIARATPSCGCTVAQVPVSPIDVAGTARVPVTLTISDPGSKSAQITLELEIPGAAKATHLLGVRAIGRRSKQLRLQPSYADFRTGNPIHVSLYAVDQDSTLAPAAPKIASPDAVIIEPGSWELVTLGAPERGVPTRWENKLVLSLQTITPAMPDSKESDLRIMVGGYPDVRLGCRLPDVK